MSEFRRRSFPRRISSRSLAAMGPRKLAVFLLLLLLGLFASRWEDRTGDTLAGTVVKVVDGDTLLVDVAGDARRIRLIGVDTPETVHPNKPVQHYGREASAFTKRTLSGRRVWLEYDVAPLYKCYKVTKWKTKNGKLVILC